MEKSAEENEVARFLLNDLKIRKKDVKKVIEILSSRGNLDAKLSNLRKLRIKHLDSVIASVCLFTLDDAIVKSYFRVVLAHKQHIEKMLLASPTEIRDLMLVLASTFQCQLNASGDKLGILFLILPILRLTGIVPMDIMVRILKILAEEYKIPMDKMIKISNDLTAFFLTDQPAPAATMGTIH